VSSKVLIVEGEIILAIDLKIRLENLGYYVPGIAVNGRDAIKKTAEKNPDIVLMDILLDGETDGVEVAQQIRKKYNIPIVYLTGSQNYNQLERDKITEQYCCINKPFDNIEIENAIQLAVSKTNSSG
jgi:two-component system, response regulator PdtaR